MFINAQVEFYYDALLSKDCPDHHLDPKANVDIHFDFNDAQIMNRSFFRNILVDRKIYKGENTF